MGLSGEWGGTKSDANGKSEKWKERRPIVEKTNRGPRISAKGEGAWGEGSSGRTPQRKKLPWRKHEKAGEEKGG